MRIASAPGGQFISRQQAMLQVGLLAAVVASGPTSDAVRVGLLVWALRSPLAAFQALTLFVVVRNFNPQLATQGALGGVLAWALPIVVSMRLLPLITRESLRLLVPLWVFCGVAALCSILTSPALAVSLLKAATLALVASGVLIGSQQLTRAETDSVGTWLRTLAIVVTVLSLLTIVRPSIMHMPRSALLVGILSHSQALGIFLAPFAAGSLAHWMLTRRSAALVETISLGAILICIALTLSRTAAVAMTLGFALGILGGSGGDWRTATADVHRALGLAVAFGIVLLVIELVTGSILPSISEFLRKGGEGSVGEAFEASRGGLVSSQLRNFMASPWIGNGFGVYADGIFPSGVRTFLGIPVSASVEKGVLPTAVLEETGLIGFVAFAYLVYVMVSGVWRKASHAVVAMLITCLFVNLGEAVLLSPGGMGLHVWLLMAWCLRMAQLESMGAVANEVAERPPGALSRPFPNVLD